MPPNNPLQPAHQPKDVTLCQVYPPLNSDIATDVDVIAIHGLDTDSPRTWTWEFGDPEKQNVNWLKDSDMLPSKIPNARIFTCNWPADLFEWSDHVQTTIDELARLLLAKIQNRPPAINEDRVRNTRPIIFIASCLGGVLLMKALVMANNDYLAVGQATRGIVFLATPFRGTSFQSVAKWADPGLRAWALAQKKNVSNMLQHTKSSFELGELRRSFAAFCQNNNLTSTGSVFAFYEIGVTSLPRKIIPWLPILLSQEQPLVEKDDAIPDIVAHPLALRRPHVLMNKFWGSDDPGYESVSGSIKTLVHNVCIGSPFRRAYTYMKNTCYSLEKLSIERLSGEPLPMDRCYINLTIVEKPRDKAGGSTQGSEVPRDSPFSLWGRLGIEGSETEDKITLSTLFKHRRTHSSQAGPRILIRGRAGVGKTTLCKKIVYEFTYRGLWRGLFDHVLWVPLRSLKLTERHKNPTYNFRDLFHHEYFSLSSNGDEFAQVWHTLTENSPNKLLFLLDGLDEVLGDLLPDGMFHFLKELLQQPNVIVTSRPSAILPPWLKSFQLELETIGFYPEQVDAYIQSAFTDAVKIEQVKSFLSQHELMQTLMRIPIQLDAFCYTWNESHNKEVTETMTAIYQNIERGLWRKDVRNLEKQNSTRIEQANEAEIGRLISSEACALGILALSGIYSDIIEFEPKHRTAISTFLYELNITIPCFDMMLGRVSFLRSSNPSSRAGDRSYHFLHLTYQEYFAARYFVQQWKAREPLRWLVLSTGEQKEIDPTEFLGRNKYNNRYEILWRFVAGLLDAEGKAPLFFETIEAEQRDLLGFAHQRLIMRCMSEVSPGMPSRETLEGHLLRWILLEHKFKNTGSRLAVDLEFPISVLEKALQQGPGMKTYILSTLEWNRNPSRQLTELVASCLKDEDEDVRCKSLLTLGNASEVSEDHLQTIIAYLKDDNNDIWGAARAALRGKQLTGDHLQTLIAYMKDGDPFTRFAALDALAEGPATEDLLQAIVACLKDDDDHVRQAAAKALGGKQLTENHLEAILACLKDKNQSVVLEALKVFADRPVTEHHLHAIMACLKDRDQLIVCTALKVLKNKLISEDLLRDVVTCLEDESDYVRKAARELLQSRPSPSEGILQATTVIEMREHPPDLPASIARLKNKDPRVRELAVTTLRKHSVLPEGLLQAIAECLKDQDEYVREAAINVLKGQTTLSKEILQPIAACLKNKGRKVRRAATEALRSQATLPKEIHRAIIECLKIKTSEIRYAAIKALEVQTTLPKETLQSIAGCLKDQDEYIREAAIKALGGQTTLSKGVIQSIAACLKDKDGAVRKAAIRVLGGQPTLSGRVFQAVAICLGGGDLYVRAAATLVLIRHQSLSLVPNRLVKSFYEALLKGSFTQSFVEHVTWQIVGKTSYITLGNEEYCEDVPDRFISAIRKAQRELGVPTHPETRPHSTLRSALYSIQERFRSKSSFRRDIKEP
ncbi:ARM repeat-containing protein [Nemania sp. FL0031]|nr:ARM repeat-containing protein [Nemania sp. FL0031]